MVKKKTIPPPLFCLNIYRINLVFFRFLHASFWCTHIRVSSFIVLYFNFFLYAGTAQINSVNWSLKRGELYFFAFQAKMGLHLVSLTNRTHGKYFRGGEYNPVVSPPWFKLVYTKRIWLIYERGVRSRLNNISSNNWWQTWFKFQG